MSEDVYLAAVEALEKRFSGRVCEYCKENSVWIAAELIIEACKMLRDEFGFDALVEETAVDYWPELKPRFNVVYRIRSIQHNQIIGLRVALDGNAPVLPTLETIYPNANWLEREVWDMFGVRFEGHSDPRRILMPEDWAGHPLRKDYPLGYEEVQFSFNFEEIDIRKPYAKS